MTHGLLNKPPYHGRYTLHIKLLLIHLEEVKYVLLNANHLAWYELDRAVYIPIQHANMWTVIVRLLIQLMMNVSIMDQTDTTIFIQDKVPDFFDKLLKASGTISMMLTHCGPVKCICNGNLSHHWFR